jgi:protein SCO1/2
MDEMERGKRRGTSARSFARLLCASAAASLVATTATQTCAARQCAGHAHMQHVHVQQTQAQERPSFTRTVASYAPPDVTLVDMNGGRVALASALNYEGPVFLQFIFTTCPTVCPVMSGTFSAAQDRLGADLARVRMISISIDPEQDTLERLREYARRFKAGRQWLFLTGDLDDIIAVQKSFDAYRGNKMRHGPLTFIRAAPGNTWVRLDGLMSAAQLVAEYRRLTSQ